MAKRRFRIHAGRYGGETTAGVINPDFVEFMQGKDSDEIVEIVMAWEYHEYNQLGAYVGEGTPVYLHSCDIDQLEEYADA